MVSVKPDPDNAFQRCSDVSPLYRASESYLAASRAFDDRSSWLSPSRTVVDDSRRPPTSGIITDTSTVWPVARQRFSDGRDAAVAPPVLEENYAAPPRPTVDADEYRQRRGGGGGGSPVVDCSGRDHPWRAEDDRSPPTLPPAVDVDPYRTVAGRRRAADPGAYRPGAAGEAGDDDDDDGLYRPRRLLADFYRHVERQDRRPRQQQEAPDEVDDDCRLMGETGRWVKAKAASAYDGSPPVERQSAVETTSYFNGRRLTWPFGTSAARRRQPQLPAAAADPYQYYVDEDVDMVDRSAVPQQSAETGAAASPISRLIQRYDHGAMASSSATEALPVATSMRHALSGAAGRADWFPLSWQPPITSAAAVDSGSSTGENSMSISEHGEGIKTYSCHICSYIGW